MVSDLHMHVPPDVNSVALQAPSKKAGKKVTSTPKKGGAAGASKVAKVHISASRSENASG